MLKQPLNEKKVYLEILSLIMENNTKHPDRALSGAKMGEILKTPTYQVRDCLQEMKGHGYIRLVDITSYQTDGTEYAVSEILPKGHIFFNGPITQPEEPSKSEQNGIVIQNFHNHGVAMVGDGNKVKNINFSNSSSSNIDMEALANELIKIRDYLAEQETQEEYDSELGAITKAESLARRGDEAGVIKRLAKFGPWFLDAATQVGAGIAIEIIKKQLGM